MDRKIPSSLGAALAMNPEAMHKFTNLTDVEKWQVVSGVHAVETKEDMKRYVENIITAY